MEKYRSHGLQLAFVREVPDEPTQLPIVLVHGFGSTHRVNWVATGWSKLLVEAGFPVLLPDGRGHGQSAKPHVMNAYRLQAMAEDVVALLDHLQIPKAHLMGYSMGGMVSLVAAMDAGERFDKVIVAGIGENLLETPRDPGPVVHALTTEDPDTISDPEARLFRTFADQNGQDRHALALCFQMVRKPFPAAGLQFVQNPTLVVAGEKDVTAGDPRPLAEAVPGAKAHVVAKRDHMKTVGDKDYKQAALAFLVEATT